MDTIQEFPPPDVPPKRPFSPKTNQEDQTTQKIVLSRISKKPDGREAPIQATKGNRENQEDEKLSQIASEKDIVPPRPDKTKVPSQKQDTSLARDLTLKAFQHKLGILRSIYIRFKMPLKTATNIQASYAFHGVGIGLGSILTLTTLPEIFLSVSRSISQIQDLRATNQATPQNIARAIFQNSVLDKPLLRDLVNLGLGVVVMARSIGAFTHTISPVVMASLGTAITALGSAASGLTILFGSIQTFLGAKAAISSRKTLNLKKAELENFKPRVTQDKIFLTADLFRKLRLETAVKKARMEYTKNILKACMGTFMTVGGALSLAAFFTGGWAAIGLVIAGLFIGVTATSVHIANLIYQKRTSKQIKEEGGKALSQFDALNEEEKKKLLAELKISQALNEEETERELRQFLE